MKKRNVRGQFYLIAAFVIIALIISFVTVTNYILKVDKETVVDLKTELQIEGEQVINYGIIEQSTNKEDLISNFSAAFAERAEDKQVVFIYGNSEGDVVAYQYVEDEMGKIELAIGESRTGETIIGKAKARVDSSRSADGEKITVNLANVSYDFNLQSGQNFYFIITANEGGNVNVVTA